MSLSVTYEPLHNTPSIYIPYHTTDHTATQCQYSFAYMSGDTILIIEM